MITIDRRKREAVTQDIPDHLISQLSKFISSRTGLYFPKEKWPELKRGIKDSVPALGFKDTKSCLHQLLSSSLTKKQFNTFIQHLTIGETFFFRNKNHFQILKDHILSELIVSRLGSGKNIRFWSAGCCSGEEPYSIAMLIDKMIPARQDWKITIMATDINLSFLQKAEKGVYTPWSFRNTPNQIIEKYFQKLEKDRFSISPHLKKMVRFHQLNLIEESYPLPVNNTQAMDVIFCCNVLMYFTSTHRTQVIRRLTQCLAKGGWLIVSPIETAFVQQSGLNEVRFPGVILHKKEFCKGEDSNKDKYLLREKEAFSFNKVDQQYPKIFPDPSSLPPLHSPQTEKEIKKKSSSDSFKQDLYQKASTLYKKGCYEESAQNLTEFLSHGQPNDDLFLLHTESMALLAKNLANLGKLDEARKWSERAINTEKLNPGYYYLLSTIFQEQGLLREAIKSLKQALYLDPKFVIAHFALGNLARQQGDFHESKKYFNNALSLLLSMDPKDILPHSEGIIVEGFVKVVQSMINKEQ